MDLIERTWHELGVRSVRVTKRRLLIVRTAKATTMTASGLLWLPTKLHGFYGELPHKRVVKGTVLASGPGALVPVGSYVAFARLHFARWQELEEPDTFVGWIDEGDLIGFVEDEVHPALAPSKRGQKEVARGTENDSREHSRQHP